MATVSRRTYGHENEQCNEEKCTQKIIEVPNLSSYLMFVIEILPVWRAYYSLVNEEFFLRA